MTAHFDPMRIFCDTAAKLSAPISLLSLPRQLSVSTCFDEKWSSSESKLNLSILNACVEEMRTCYDPAIYPFLLINAMDISLMHACFEEMRTCCDPATMICYDSGVDSALFLQSFNFVSRLLERTLRRFAQLDQLLFQLIINWSVRHSDLVWLS